jgi:hypothetical protein
VSYGYFINVGRTEVNFLSPARCFARWLTRITEKKIITPEGSPGALAWHKELNAEN